MNCKALLLLMLFLINQNAFGQAQSTPPTNRIPSAGSRAPLTIRRDNSKFDQLRSLEVRRIDEKPFTNPVFELATTVYRKPSKEELKFLKPSQHLLDKYNAFLREKNTGLTKLNADSSCAHNNAVVVAKENCLQYQIPGAGTAFSFRTGNYQMPHLADIILSKEILKTDGVLQQGLIVDLGNVPLTDVNLTTKGLKHLLEFKPASDTEALLKHDSDLSEGIASDGFLYRLGYYVTDQTTFALRSIAFKGKFVRSINGYAYNELDFDKRKDIIVVFRVVEKDVNGNITLLWKILSETNAAELKAKQIK